MDGWMDGHGQFSEISVADLLVYRIWRSSLILSFASCYIMWGTYSHRIDPDYTEKETEAMSPGIILTLTTAITFLAQWHPLIVPRRGDLRDDYARHMS